MTKMLRFLHWQKVVQINLMDEVFNQRNFASWQRCTQQNGGKDLFFIID